MPEQRAWRERDGKAWGELGAAGDPDAILRFDAARASPFKGPCRYELVIGHMVIFLASGSRYGAH